MQMYSELELVELDDGEIVLRQAHRRVGDAKLVRGADADTDTVSTDTTAEAPMLRLRFSDESMAQLHGLQLDIAHHMVMAGIQRYNQLMADSMQALDVSKSEADMELPAASVPRRLLH